MKKNHPQLDDYFEAARNVPVEPSMKDITQLIQNAPAPLVSSAKGSLWVSKSWWIASLVVASAVVTSLFLWPSHTPELISSYNPDLIIEEPVIIEEEPVLTPIELETPPVVQKEAIPDHPETTKEPLKEEPEAPLKTEDGLAIIPATDVDTLDREVALLIIIDHTDTSSDGTLLACTTDSAFNCNSAPDIVVVPNEPLKRTKPADRIIEFRDDMSEEEFTAAIEMMQSSGLNTDDLDYKRKRSRYVSMTGKVAFELQERAREINVYAWEGQGFKRIYFHLRYDFDGDLDCVAIEIDGQKAQKIGCEGL